VASIQRANPGPKKAQTGETETTHRLATGVDAGTEISQWPTALTSRIRPLRVAAPGGEGREPEQSREQHRSPEHERRHALQPHRPPCPAAAAAATAPSSSASAGRPVRRRLAGVLPHAARSHASRPAAAADKTWRPAIAAAGSTGRSVGGGGARARGRGGRRCLRRRGQAWEGVEVGEEGERKGEVNRSEVKCWNRTKLGGGGRERD
jgi:hypothetical protein